MADPKIAKKAEKLLIKFGDNLGQLIPTDGAPLEAGDAAVRKWFDDALHGLLASIPSDVGTYIAEPANFQSFSDALFAKLDLHAAPPPPPPEPTSIPTAAPAGTAGPPNETQAEERLRLVALGYDEDDHKATERWGWAVGQKSWPELPKYIRIRLNHNGLQIMDGIKVHQTVPLGEIDRWGIKESAAGPKLMLVLQGKNYILETRLATYLDRKLQRLLGEVDADLGDDEELLPKLREDPPVRRYPAPGSDGDGDTLPPPEAEVVTNRKKFVDDGSDGEVPGGDSEEEDAPPVPPGEDEGAPPPPPEDGDAPPPPPSSSKKKKKADSKKKSKPKGPALDDEGRPVVILKDKADTKELPDDPNITEAQQWLRALAYKIQGDEPLADHDQERWGWPVEQRSWPELPKYVRVRVTHNGLQIMVGPTAKYTYGLFDLDAWGVNKKGKIPQLMFKVLGAKYVVCAKNVEEIEEYLHEILA